MKAFLVALEEVVKKDYPDIVFQFYLLRRSKFVGSDLFSTKNYSLSPIKPTIVNCGLSVKIPEGYFGLISGRSPLALKCVTAHMGIIDNDYRGCACVILINLNFHNYEIEIGDRIGQLTLVKYDKAVFKEVLNFNVKSLERVGGFGSTGKILFSAPLLEAIASSEVINIFYSIQRIVKKHQNAL